MFLEHYAETAAKLTDAPEVFHEYLALACVSSVVGNHVYLREGRDTIYPNVWVSLVGPSSSYRKSTSLNICKDMIRSVREESLYPDEFSQERLLEIMENQPTGTLFYYEFASLMSMLDRSYMIGTKAFLTSLYDNPYVYKKELKNKKLIVINQPSVNILTATTSQWMVGNLSESDILGGFLPRFLIVPAYEKKRSEPFRGPDDQAAWMQCVDELSSLKDIRGCMKFSDEAKHEYIEWYRSFEKQYCGSGQLSPFYVRMQTYCLKFSILHELAINQSLEISTLSVAMAIEKINWLAKQVAKFQSEELVFSREGKTRQRLLNIIAETGEIKRTKLLQRSHLKSKEFDEWIKTLKEDGTVGEEEDYTEEGRPYKKYFLHASYQPKAREALIDENGAFHPAISTESSPQSAIG